MKNILKNQSGIVFLVPLLLVGLLITVTTVGVTRVNEAKKAEKATQQAKQDQAKLDGVLSQRQSPQAKPTPATQPQPTTKPASPTPSPVPPAATPKPATPRSLAWPAHPIQSDCATISKVYMTEFEKTRSYDSNTGEPNGWNYGTRGYDASLVNRLSGLGFGTAASNVSPAKLSCHSAAGWLRVQGMGYDGSTQAFYLKFSQVSLVPPPGHCKQYTNTQTYDQELPAGCSTK